MALDRNDGHPTRKRNGETESPQSLVSEIRKPHLRLLPCGTALPRHGGQALRTEDGPTARFAKKEIKTQD